MTARRQITGAPASFTDLGVPRLLAEALARQNISHPFPVQTATLPDSLAGRDIIGKGRTGSGKTYAFVLPVLARLSTAPRARRPRRPRALVLAPTRELATQIDVAIAPLAAVLSLRTMTVFGGVSAERQIAELRTGVDVLVACPGRLADLAGRGHVDLGDVEITVIDEADHMADLGFLPVVRRLLELTPAGRQRLLFSATIDSAVDVLVRMYLRHPVTHDADPVASVEPPPTHHVLYVDEAHRIPVLVDLTAAPGRTIVFTRTKHRAKSLTRALVAAGIRAVELHGNLAQNARDRNLRAFAAGTVTTLVATDIAARGIHVDDVRIVIHADPPAEHKAYLHRSGRTGRAGASGTIVTLSTDAQRTDVQALTRRAGVAPTVTRVSVGHPLLARLAPGERTFVRPAAPTTASGTSIHTPAAGHRSVRPNHSTSDTPRSTRRRVAPAASSAHAPRRLQRSQ
jgi:superfamily II DNA/RNA helicase